MTASHTGGEERLLTDSPVQRTAILISTMIASSMSTTNITVVNVVLPQMRGDLSAGIEEISWVLTATMIAMAISMPTGWLGRPSVRQPPVTPRPDTGVHLVDRDAVAGKLA